MSITGIDAVTFGVCSLAKAKRFMADWGLQKVRAGKFGADYVCVDGGEVKIRSHDRAAIIDAEPGEYAALEVVDTGHGMSAETIEQAFEPFFTTKEIGQGTGLGLSMVYGFAKKSGGYVEIESEIGRGTTVRLCLRQADSETRIH